LFNGTVEAYEAMTEYDVYKNVLQKAGWASLGHFCIYIYFFKIKNAGKRSQIHRKHPEPNRTDTTPDGNENSIFNKHE
jgi:hypothetical protein